MSVMWIRKKSIPYSISPPPRPPSLLPSRAGKKETLHEFISQKSIEAL